MPARSAPGPPPVPVPSRRRARQLLHSAEPRDILGRIVPDDPLGLRLRVARRARERALLVDGERAFLRALVLCAAGAPGFRGRAPGPWLTDRVDEALDDVLRTRPVGPELTQRLGLEPEAFAAGLARFHRLPAPERDAFVRLVLEAIPPEEAARLLHTSAARLARGARRGLRALLGETHRPRGGSR